MIRLALASAQRVSADRQRNHDTDNYLLDEGGDARQVQAIVKDANNQNADHGTANTADATAQAGPANHHGSDGVKFITEAGTWLRGVQTARQHDAPKTREQSGCCVNPGGHLPHPDPCQTRYLSAATDGIKAPTCGAVTQKDPA